MTPKEKAKELVALFEYEDNLGIAENTGIEGIDKNQAKECALIAVDEMSKVYELLAEDADLMFKNEINYLEELKQEIEKL
jgi:hypothetical protein